MGTVCFGDSWTDSPFYNIRRESFCFFFGNKHEKQEIACYDVVWYTIVNYGKLCCSAVKNRGD
ncbi:hypothetical protein D7V86_02495 [bacterium D16-51]|nr:hypothetical protein D7V96_01920 [bacterium D16-59]RKI62405.1 hypothetical protein D7V86_02495 [bacterium D16-51]